VEEVLPISKGSALTSPEEVGAVRHRLSAIASTRGLAMGYAIAVTVLVVFGSAALLPLWVSMARLWATDPLRSIGAIFPALALTGVLLRWRDLGWAARGTAWGLPIVAVTILVARMASVSKLEVTMGGTMWGLLPLGPPLFLYATGATLLFGGPKLFRAALGPLCLLLAINPVPHAFNGLADLPLQQLSASTARAFAHLIGLRPTGEQLRMMFAPNFGMLIVPGCNGVRGSVTLAYLTLIFGYTRRLRPGRLIAAALSALMLGYALNLLRLCVLVVYYRIGLTFPSVQPYGVGVDYAIGCTLFLLATVGIGLGVRALEPQKSQIAEAADLPAAQVPLKWPVVRGLCLLALTLVFIVPELHSLASIPALRPNEQKVLALFPAQVGPYRLVSTRSERDGDDMISLGLADYVAEGNRRIAFGMWVSSADHMVAGSRLVQGLKAEWTGSFDTVSGTGLPIHFVSSEYDTGVSRVFDVESACSPQSCSVQIAGSRNQGFRFVGPRLGDLMLPPTGKRLPIIFERESLTSDPAILAIERTQFEEDVRLFIQQIDLQSLVQQAGSRP